MPRVTQYFPDLDGAAFTRTGAKIAPDATGDLALYAANIPAVTSLGILIEGGTTNFCTNTNVNPVATTNITLTDLGSGASLVVADDTAAIAAAGLDAVCTNGDVFRLIGGTVGAYADVTGATVNTNPAWGSAYIRGGTGVISTDSNGSSTAFIAAAGYVRRATSVIALASKKLRIKADAGETVYFILNQLESNPAVSASIVPLAGASADHGPDLASISFTLATEGTLFVEFVGPPFGVVPLWGSAAEANLLYTEVSAECGSVVNGVNLFTANHSIIGAISKAALSWTATGRTLCLDGGATVSDAQTPAGLGGPFSMAGSLRGNLRKVIIYDAAMSSAELQALTT